jgi:flavin reductase (DIM6/NTAB) family NADH-FMN oxidoreductase RutF
MAISQEEFRQTLGHFATGVKVVTVVRGQGQVHGMTANAVSSVSLLPPLVLVCVDHSARTYSLLKEQKRFGINVLGEQQEALARYYADTNLDHETAVHLGVRYSYTERGTPLLEDCLAQLDCTLVAVHEAGDHTIFVGEVEGAAVRDGRPLLFYCGQFRRLEANST